MTMVTTKVIGITPAVSTTDVELVTDADRVAAVNRSSVGAFLSPFVAWILPRLSVRGASCVATRRQVRGFVGGIIEIRLSRAKKEAYPYGCASLLFRYLTNAENVIDLSP